MLIFCFMIYLIVTALTWVTGVQILARGVQEDPIPVIILTLLFGVYVGTSLLSIWILGLIQAILG